MGIVNKKRKRISVLFKSDSEKLNKKVEDVRNEIIAAKSLVASVSGTTEADPFKEVRAAIAMECCEKALQKIQKLTEFIDSKTEAGT